ncbi:RHS repeat-associated core domain-containing protein [Duganella sp. CY15W]|uniref:RHS repeat-associated core domain-containing protein n=1 Tax=Duganella sp. CY15W TaxID=2692172 RepID=UPI0035A31F01
MTSWDWLDYPSTCTWTATGPAGTKTYDEIWTTQSPPVDASCAAATPKEGHYIARKDNGTIWGDNANGYSLSSDVEIAMVHAAIARPGQGATVYFTPLGRVSNLRSSTSFGVTSLANPGPVCAYRLRGTTDPDDPNVPPTVSFTTPEEGRSFVSQDGKPVTVNVSGTAASAPGNVIKLIEVIDGTSSLASISSNTSINVYVPMALGEHQLQLRATDSAGRQSSTQVFKIKVVSPTSGNAAAFMSQTVPVSMYAGEPTTVTIKMANTGTTTWVPDGQNPYRLGAQSPQDNQLFRSSGRANLKSAVAPGEVGVFAFTVTPPRKAGTYKFQWKMLREFVEWFGESTPAIDITVFDNPSLSATISAAPSSVRVNGTSKADVMITASGSSGGVNARKLEIFQDNGDNNDFDSSPINSTTGAAYTLNQKFTVSLGAGTYWFKSRVTDDLGHSAESERFAVNVTNSGILGKITGVRFDGGNKPQLVGWVCEDRVDQSLNYEILLDAPTLKAGATQLATGVANVGTEADDATVQSTCHTPGRSHHFVVDLSPYTGLYSSRAIYIRALGSTAGSDIVLPCADANCTMPGSLRVALSTPLDGQHFNGAGPVFIRTQLSGGSGPYDEVAIGVDGVWTVASADGAVDAYSLSFTGMTERAAPYAVRARVRQGNSTLYSATHYVYVDSAAAVSVNIASPANGSSVNAGGSSSLSASVAGNTASVASVKFYGNGQLIGTAVQNGTSWTASWNGAVAGQYSVVATAFDANGVKLAQSAAVSVTVKVASGGNAGGDLQPVAITPPFLDNADAGSLPGELGVDANGAATYSVPLAVPPGTAGLAPSLSLNYSSSGNNGHVGVGWNLGGLSSIHRCGKTIAQDGINARINFDTGDRLCLDGARLVLTGAKLTDDTYWADDAVYRTEIDSFVRIKAQGTGSARTFVAEYKDGRVATFGNPDKAVNARVLAYVTFDSAKALKDTLTRADAQSWALDKVTDRSGNFITFHYTQNSSTGEHLIDAIRYGGSGMKPHAMVQFSYEARSDGWTRYIDGTRNDLRQRIAHIKTYVGNDMSGTPAATAMVRDYTLNYDISPSSGRSLLKSVAASAANPATGTMEALPATTFEWGAPDPGKTAGFVSRGLWPGAPILTTHAKSQWRSANHPDYFAFQDLENHGYTDVLEKRVANPYPMPGTEENLDLAANPERPGKTQQRYRYFHNNGHGFDEYQYQLDTQESFVVLDLGDFNGDGAPDLLVTTDKNVAKICLSPLAKGITTARSEPITFACASTAERPATGVNTVDGMPYVIDVVGDGRSAIYGELDPSAHTAPLYIQNEQLVDKEPPYSVLHYSREDQRNFIADTLQRFVTFDQIVDFAGIGKHADVRWTLPYVRPFMIDDRGEPVGRTGWVNLEPSIIITDFHRPGTPRLGKMRGYAMHDEYPAPVCVAEHWPDNFGGSRYACDPAPYRFDAPSGGAVADFSGSGYSNLMFGFVEINKFNEAPRADATLCLSTGRELDCGALAEHSGASYKVAQAIGDFVGDGAPAVLMRETRRGKDTSGRDMAPVAVGGLQMCRLTGMGGTSADVRTSCASWTGLEIPNESSDASDQLFYMDLLGTGRTQAVYYHAGKSVSNVWQEDGRWEVFEPLDMAVDGQALDRIHKVTNGLGAVSGVEYRDGLVSGVVSRTGNSDLTTSYPQHVALSPGKLVSRLKQANGVAAQHTTSYRYFDPATDVAGRGALGFAAVESRDEQSGIVTTTQYSHVWPKNGQVRTVTVASGSVELARTSNTPAYKQFVHPSGESTYQPYIDTSEVVRHDLDGTSLGKVTTRNTYDESYGNLKNQRVTSTIDDKTLFVTEVATEFQNDEAKWLIGLPTSVTTTRTDPASGSAARKVAYAYDSVTGLRSKETVQPAETLYQVVTDYLRSPNKFGLVEETRQTWTDPLDQQVRTRSSKTGYDGNGRYVVSATNAAGHTESYKYVAGTGARSERTDANNQVTQWTTDGFGRVRKETRSNGNDSSSVANETRVYQKSCLANACPGMSGAAVVQITEQFHGASRIAVPTLVYRDSVGHVLRTQTHAFNGDATYVDQSYDSLGRLMHTSQPAYLTNTSPVMASRLEYDLLNRVVVAATLDEAGKELLTKTAYQGLKITLTNPKLQGRTDERNVIGQVVKVTDALQGVTEFVYDPLGNLSQTTDPGKSIIKVEYDKLGRKTALVDLDLGRIEYTVDPVGRVRAQSSKLQRDKKQRTEMDYDLLDRMVSRVQSDQKAYWKYDTSAYGKGQLAEASTVALKDDYLRVHTYDSYGRPDTTTQTLTGGAYISQVVYDDWGRAIAQKYTGAGKTKQFDLRYNKNGYLSAVERGGQKLWSVSKQDAANRPTELALGNGLTQVLGYDPGSGRLTSDQVKTAASALRLDQGYAYDGLGSVVTRTQYWDTHGFMEGFTYDGLNRLETSKIGEATQTFKYNANGSLRSKSGVGSGDYVYPQALEQRPHAVSSIPGYASFKYDDNGNLTSAGSQSIEWTSFDMPRLIKKGDYNSSFVYGSEYQRVRQDRGDGLSIVYAGAQEVELQNGAVSKVRTYWPMGIGFEVDMADRPVQLVWTHKDRLGSPVALTGDDGQIIEQLAYDAWGKRRSAVDNSTPDAVDGVTDHRGFTGHEMLDQLDLVHMNGRVYDPFTAKFLSGDPLVQDPMNGQNYNRYSYVLNNPTNLTDPTGFESVTIKGDRINVVTEGFKLQDVLRALQQQQQAGRKTVTVAFSWPALFGTRIAKRGGYTVTVRLAPDDSDDSENSGAPKLRERGVIESEISAIQGRMKEIDDGGFSGGKKELSEYARLNSQLFHDKTELAEVVRRYRADTPFSQWSKQDWEDAANDVAGTLAARGSGIGGSRAPPLVTYSSSRGALGNGYTAVGEVTATVKNAGLLNALSKAGPGTWEKVYEAGIMKGQQIEVHYFRNESSGRVFDVKIKYDNWHQREFRNLGQ